MAARESLALYAWMLVAPAQGPDEIHMAMPGLPIICQANQPTYVASTKAQSAEAWPA